MNRTLIQAYRQTPWRSQLQMLGGLLAVLIAVAIVAGLYLNISAQAATAGLEFQKLEADREDMMRDISDMSTRLAYLSSEAVMRKRAEALGFKPVSMEKAVYVVVPGFTGRQLPNFAPPPGIDMINEPLLKPAFTQSLWDWFYQGVLRGGK